MDCESTVRFRVKGLIREFPNCEPVADHVIEQIIRGDVRVSNGPNGREAVMALWCRLDNKIVPCGVFCSAVKGVFGQKEFGLLSICNSEISYARLGGKSSWYKNAQLIGKSSLRFCLGGYPFGETRVYVKGVYAFSFWVPLIGPSMNQKKDCVGTIRCCSPEQHIRFVIKAHLSEGESGGLVAGAGAMFRAMRDNDVFSNRPPLSSTAIFQEPNSIRLMRSYDARAIALGAAVWSRSLYTNMGGFH